MYPARVQELDDDDDDRPLVGSDHTTVSEEEDEDDKPLVRPPFWRDPSATLEQDVSGTSRERTKDVSSLGKNGSSAIRRVPTPLRSKKRPSVWRDPSATLEQHVSGTSRERSEDVSGLGNNSDGEALQRITN